jgi:hypothetical protein
VLELNSKLAPLSPLDYTMLLLREGVVPFVEQHVVVASDAGTIRLLDIVVCDKFLLCTGLCFVVPKTGPSSSPFDCRLCRAYDSGGVDNIVSGGLEYALPDPFLSHHGPAEQLEQVQVSCCGFVYGRLEYALACLLRFSSAKPNCTQVRDLEWRRPGGAAPNIRYGATRCVLSCALATVALF